MAVRASAEGYQEVERKVVLPAGGQASVFLPLERIPGPGVVKGRVLREEGRDGTKVPVPDVEVHDRRARGGQERLRRASSWCPRPGRALSR